MDSPQTLHLLIFVAAVGLLGLIALAKAYFDGNTGGMIFFTNLLITILVVPFIVYSNKVFQEVMYLQLFANFVISVLYARPSERNFGKITQACIRSMLFVFTFIVLQAYNS